MEQTGFIPVEELQKLEKLIRLHYDLDINVEGIDAIVCMTERIENLQQEIIQLKNRLKLYEK